MTDKQNFDTARHLFSLIRLKADCKITPTLVDFTPPFMYYSTDQAQFHRLDQLSLLTIMTDVTLHQPLYFPQKRYL